MADGAFLLDLKNALLIYYDKILAKVGGRSNPMHGLPALLQIARGATGSVLCAGESKRRNSFKHLWPLQWFLRGSYRKKTAQPFLSRYVCTLFWYRRL